jgi:hypothetical protein
MQGTEAENNEAIDQWVSQQKQMALRYILDAWEEAVIDGVDPDLLARAAMFAALSDMVAAYGEDPVAVLTDGLGERIRHGEFTVNRTTQ